MSLGIRGRTDQTTPKPTTDEVNAARDEAFAAVTRWLHLATLAGQSTAQIMRELGGMMRK